MRYNADTGLGVPLFGGKTKGCKCCFSFKPANFNRGAIVMKATGMVRPVDTLGRIVIPREIRKMFDIKDGEDHFEIFVSDNQIVLKKYEPCCVFCSEVGDTVIMNDRIVCKNCIEKLQNLL